MNRGRSSGESEKIGDGSPRRPHPTASTRPSRDMDRSTDTASPESVEPRVDAAFARQSGSNAGPCRAQVVDDEMADEMADETSDETTDETVRRIAHHAGHHDLREVRLFARAAEGDREAIAEVWRRNRRWIASVLAAHAPRGADLDDLLQEVAATLVAKCRHLRDSASLRGWLRVVAVNAARMAARRRAVERKSLREVARSLDGRSTVDGSCGPEELRAVLARLPALYAEPLLLQSGQGLSQRQIAELLDVPETTVETRLARARRMLRRIMSEDDACGRHGRGAARETVGGGPAGAGETPR